MLAMNLRGVALTPDELRAADEEVALIKGDRGGLLWDSRMSKLLRKVFRADQININYSLPKPLFDEYNKFYEEFRAWEQRSFEVRNYAPGRWERYVDDLYARMLSDAWPFTAQQPAAQPPVTMNRWSDVVQQAEPEFLRWVAMDNVQSAEMKKRLKKFVILSQFKNAYDYGSLTAQSTAKASTFVGRMASALLKPFSTWYFTNLGPAGAGTMYSGGPRWGSAQPQQWDNLLNRYMSLAKEAVGEFQPAKPAPARPLDDLRLESRLWVIPWWPLPAVAVAVGLYWYNKEGKGMR